MGSHRLWSPNPGSSILMTSAPHSCIVSEAWGPWTRSPASRTRTPSRGPFSLSLVESWRRGSPAHLCDLQRVGQAQSAMQGPADLLRPTSPEIDERRASCRRVRPPGASGLCRRPGRRRDSVIDQRQPTRRSTWTRQRPVLDALERAVGLGHAARTRSPGRGRPGTAPCSSPDGGCHPAASRSRGTPPARSGAGDGAPGPRGSGRRPSRR